MLIFLAQTCQKKKLFFIYHISPFEWTEPHGDYLLSEMMTVEPHKYKVGSPKRGNGWTQIADMLHSTVEHKFRVNQRSVRNRFNLL